MFIDLSEESRYDRVTQVLRYLVYRAGYSQRSLAKKMDVSQSYVAHILLGDRKVDFVACFKWLDALDCQPVQFLELLDTGVGLEEDWPKM